MSAVSIREFVETDFESLRNIDTLVATDHFFSVSTNGTTLQLSRVRLDGIRVKRFEIAEKDLAECTTFVSLNGDRACGLISLALEPWHRRLVIRHFYVDIKIRGRGVGRKLLARALEQGRAMGAQTAWVEASNLNSPGIMAYMRLGFEICGFDTTFYTGTSVEDEFAVFLAKPI